MAGDWKENGSFLFGTTDMYAVYGIKLKDDSIPEDVLLPGLRSRKVKIPLRHGSYDYGAHYYDERAIRIECITSKALSRNDCREIAYVLSKKEEIRFWTEPDKYYVGRIYQAPTLEQLRNVGAQFQLDFVCEPFAYGETKTEQFTEQTFTPDYVGTAPTPTYIVIRNIGTTNVSNIKITQVDKKE